MHRSVPYNAFTIFARPGMYMHACVVCRLNLGWVFSNTSVPGPPHPRAVCPRAPTPRGLPSSGSLNPGTVCPLTRPPWAPYPGAITQSRCDSEKRKRQRGKSSLPSIIQTVLVIHPIVRQYGRMFFIYIKLN